MNNELREWSGLATADFPVYAACLFVVVMYFNNGIYLDAVLSAVSIILCIAACVIGMKKDSKLSDFTNTSKLIAYPLCLMICLILVYVNFTNWNSVH
jgi:hypothetical protein